MKSKISSDEKLKRTLVAARGLQWHEGYGYFAFDTLRSRLLSGRAAVRTYGLPWKFSYVNYKPLALRSHLLRLFLQQQSMKGRVSLLEASKLLGTGEGIIRQLYTAGEIASTRVAESQRNTRLVEMKQLTKELLTPKVQHWLCEKRARNLVKLVGASKYGGFEWEKLILEK